MNLAFNHSITAAGSIMIDQQSISQLIEREEIPLRCRSLSKEIVRAIFRHGAVMGSVIEHRHRISRGGELARQLIAASEESNGSFHSGTVILADEMLESRGRFKRYWHAPQGGLWMTLGLANTLLPESSLLLPMAAGVACCEVVRHYGITAHIKWVNDILVDNRKICGVLSESFTGSRFGEEYILIGIGINVNNDLFPPELADTATSMKSCLGHEVDLPEVAVRLLAKLRWNIGLLLHEEGQYLERHGGIAMRNGPGTEKPPFEDHLLLKSYKNLTDIFNRRVLFGFNVYSDPQFEARVIGLDDSGGLILEMADSSRIVQHSGEIIYLD